MELHSCEPVYCPQDTHPQFDISRIGEYSSGWMFFGYTRGFDWMEDVITFLQEIVMSSSKKFNETNTQINVDLPQEYLVPVANLEVGRNIKMTVTTDGAVIIDWNTSLAGYIYKDLLVSIEKIVQKLANQRATHFEYLLVPSVDGYARPRLTIQLKTTTEAIEIDRDHTIKKIKEAIRVFLGLTLLQQGESFPSINASDLLDKAEFNFLQNESDHLLNRHNTQSLPAPVLLREDETCIRYVQTAAHIAPAAPADELESIQFLGYVERGSAAKGNFKFHLTEIGQKKSIAIECASLQKFREARDFLGEHRVVNCNVRKTLLSAKKTAFSLINIRLAQGDIDDTV